MRPRSPLALALAVALAVAACSPGGDDRAGDDGGPADSNGATRERDGERSAADDQTGDDGAGGQADDGAGGELLDDVALEVPVRVLIVDEVDGSRSSSRTVGEIEQIFDRVQDIWTPAGIGFDLVDADRLPVESEALDALARADLAGFVQRLPDEPLEATQPSLIGFYASDIGGSNGVTPVGTTVFFVTDEPTVHDERVSAHEIGHILGLEHVPPVDRLMAAGVNGMELTDDEIAVARATAERILDVFADAEPDPGDGSG